MRFPNLEFTKHESKYIICTMDHTAGDSHSYEVSDVDVLFLLSSFSTGGAERVVSELANRFAQDGMRVLILLLSSEGAIAYSLDSRIRVRRIVSARSTEALSATVRLRAIRATVKKYKPTFVVSFMSTINMHACLALIGLQTKLIVSERNDPKKDPATRLRRILRAIVYHLADGLVFQTDYAMNHFSSGLRRRGVVIPNPLQDALPEPYDDRRDTRVVAVGRLEPQKNHHLLIGAFAEVLRRRPDAHLEIYGEGSLRSVLERFVADLGITSAVSFKGVTKSVNTEIRDAGVFVLASDFEGMPNALLEAMGMAMPCLVSDFPGHETLAVHEESALVFQRGDLHALRDEIDRLLGDHALSQRIGSGAMRQVRVADREIVYSAWRRYLHAVSSW